ncbi:MAG: hypothetical protein ACKOKF_05735 [Bacteroidota bacterium]
MFRLKNSPGNLPLQHDQLFTLEWELKGYKWLLIRYHNGQKKKWYRSTERPYRFKRWFFGKQQGSFSNLANLFSPKIEAYLFPWYLSWPKKITIPLQVSRLSAEQFSIQTTDIYNTPSAPATSTTAPQIVPVSMPITPTALNISPTIPSPGIKKEVHALVPQCDYPISEWIRQGIITESNFDPNTIIRLTNPSNHV